MTLSSFNPANGTLLRSYDSLSAEAITARIADAHQAFELYRETPLQHRVMWMKKLAGILDQEMEELATLLTMETGKTIRASREEVLQCAICCRYFADNAIRLLEDETIEMDANLCTTTWQPLGVLFAVMPGISPLWQVFRVMAPALLGGNAMVSKHADNVPQCALEIELLLRRAGFARGVFQALLIDSADVEIVLNDERVTGVAIAAMQQIGREIAAHTAWMGKKVVTDQEGSSTFLVMPSANLFAAIQAAVAARCVDNGQSSASTARFLVHETVYDEFALLFATAMEDIKIGIPLKDETELGPMSTEESVMRLKAQIASAVAAGGSVLTGGEPMLSDGNYFEPTVIVEVPADARVCRDEVHGPVAMLFKVTSLNDAIAAANRAGRNGISVWTQDESEKEQLTRRLVCGSMFVNSPTVMDARTASGNLKGAGCGQTMAAASLRDFMSAKTVVTTGLISETEFNFDLMLKEFEKEARLEAEKPEEVRSYEPFHPEEPEIKDDLFVMPQAAWTEQLSPVRNLDKAVRAVSVPAAVMLNKAEVDEVLCAVAVAPPVVVPKKTVARKKTGVTKKAVALKQTVTKKKVVTSKKAVEMVVSEPIVVDKPVIMEDPAAMRHKVIAAAEVTSQAAVLSFKEMFERALQVRA